jgi:hypothetical protein
LEEVPLFKNTAFFVVLTLMCNVSALSQNLELKRSIVDELTKNGFENLKVQIETESAIVAYENRVYRFDVEALKEVLKLVVPLLKDQKEIVLVPQNRQIPIVSLEASVSDCKDYFDSRISGKEFASRLTIRFDIDEISRKLSGEDVENSSSFRFDITAKPQAYFQFGPYGKPVTSQVNAVPELQTSWFQGMHVNSELIVPVVNQFGTRGESVRPGVLALNQVYRFPGNYFVSASAGVFTQDRYGLDLEAEKYVWNANLSYGLNVGLSSMLFFERMTSIYYSDVFAVTGSVHCNYRIPEYDLTLGVMAGKFLRDDKSLRFDMSREFGEVEIGFFAIHAFRGITNGGINITIPLFPSKYWKPGVVRARPHEDFTMSYLAKTNPDQLIGLRYNTLNRLEYFDKKLNPDFIRNYFSNTD